MKYQVRLSGRAERDLDRLDRPTKQRMIRRLEQLAEGPHNPRISGELTNEAGLRKSRVGGWRLIYNVDSGARVIHVVMIERRGQVYRRI